MELRHLRYFIAVAEEGHFGQAAERLNIVQPALSMQIKALEAELGGPLFIRTSRRVALTQAGILFQTEAIRTLEQAEHARRAVERSIRGETGRIRIGFAGNAVFSGKLMADMRLFHRAFPDAELLSRELAPYLQHEAIQNGELDIGYMPDYLPEHNAGLIYENIGKWSRVVVMCSDHPLAVHEQLTLSTLAQEPLILYSADQGESHIDAILHDLLGNDLRIAYRTASTLSVIAMAGAGMGVALVPEPLAQMAIPGVVYRKLNAPQLSANLMLVSRKDESSGAVKAYLAQARQNNGV